MKNNQGFALSATIYSLFIIMLMVIFYILYILTSNRTSVGAITKSVEAEANAESMFNPPQKDWDYGFTGDYQTFEPKLDGKYKFELWGANSRSNGDEATPAYVKGEIVLVAGQKLYVYVGEEPNGPYGGWNGGGAAIPHGYGAGGATDVRTTKGPWYENLDTRIIVAGAAGSKGQDSYYAGSSTILNSSCNMIKKDALTAYVKKSFTCGKRYEVLFNGISGQYSGTRTNYYYGYLTYSGTESICYNDCEGCIKYGTINFYKGRGKNSVYADQYYTGASGGGYYGGIDGAYISGASLTFSDYYGGGGGSSYASGFCTTVIDSSSGESFSVPAVPNYTFDNVDMRSYNTLGNAATGIPNAYDEDGTYVNDDDYVISHHGHGKVKIHYCGDSSSTC